MQVQQNNTQTVRGGVSFLSLLTILFIALKLLGAITWSWWWVLAPLWIPWFIALLVLFGFGIFLIKDEIQRNRK